MKLVLFFRIISLKQTIGNLLCLWSQDIKTNEFKDLKLNALHVSQNFHQLKKYFSLNVRKHTVDYENKTMMPLIVCTPL